MPAGADELERLVAETLASPAPLEVAALGSEVCQILDGRVAALLAYGSCLRGTPAQESLIDFYVLTPRLSHVSGNALSRLGCAFVPPNIYYAQSGGLRAKYAVVPLEQFASWMRRETANPYFWARFAQPSALLFAAPEENRQNVIRAISTALRTAYANARGLGPPASPIETWRRLFEATYATELRAESGSRAADIVAANAEFYAEAARILGNEPPLIANWNWRRRAGKLWSAARLTKAAFTFAGGADYIAWKIERHTGETITLSGWQRRHPIIAGLLLLPRLLRRGAVK